PSPQAARSRQVARKAARITAPYAARFCTVNCSPSALNTEVRVSSVGLPFSDNAAYSACRLPPPLPLGLAVAGLAGARLAFVAPPHHWCLLVGVGQPEFVRFEPPDLVAQAARFLELEVGGGGAHAFFEVLDVGAQVVADEVVAFRVVDLDQRAVAAGGVGNDVLDTALDRLRGDAVLGVVLALLFAAAVGFGDRALHAAGHPVGIKDHAAFDVAGCAPDGLDE